LYKVILAAFLILYFLVSCNDSGQAITKRSVAKFLAGCLVFAIIVITMLTLIYHLLFGLPPSVGKVTLLAVILCAASIGIEIMNTKKE